MILVIQGSLKWGICGTGAGTVTKT